MSGITPLIDTLLHQVLGKRADVPSPKPLNQPIKPTAPSEAPRALHSDSRLDARASGPAAGEAARGASRGATSATAPSQGAPLSAPTHFSATARTIADLLVRYPAPPSAVSPAAPLMAADPAASPEPLAQRLAASIRDSGLFYESHLARWYKGELSPQQLAREPQMARTLRFVPPPQAQTQAPAAEGGRGAEAPSPLAVRVRAAMPPVPFLPRAAAPLEPAAPPPLVAGASRMPAMPTAVAPLSAASFEAPPAPASADAARPSGLPAGQVLPGEAAHATEGRREAVPESLQHLVRHQLEMLASPNLRWEGDVWSGLFMALAIQLPQGRREGQAGGDEAADERQETSGGWRSELDLEVAGLGPLKVSLWMREARLDVDVRVGEASVRDRLEAGLEVLRHRLAAHGFDDVRLRLGELPEEAS